MRQGSSYSARKSRLILREREKERMCRGVGGRDREGESQAGSTTNIETATGSISWPLDHDHSQNQESAS